MEWQNKYGEKYDWFLKLQEDRDKEAAERGEEAELLPALQNRPEIFQDVVHYYIAFNELSASRQSGMGLGYIPYSEIRGYLNEHWIIDYEERLEWIQWIQFIDRLYVKIQSSEQEKKRKADERKNKQGKGVRPPPR